jgi:hypothetical protein
MMQRAMLLPLAGVTLVVVNLLFFWATFPDLSTSDETNSSARWSLPDLNRTPAPAITELMAQGFWGQVDPARFAGGTDTDAETMESVSEREARELRRRVKAIIGQGITQDGTIAQGGTVEVLFEVEGSYQRLSTGDHLPGTQWQLHKIEADRLELVQEGQAPRELRLFAASVLTETAE